MVPKDKLEEYHSIVNNVGKFFNLEFEHDVYRKIVYSNVNNYIAVTENGKIKVKGSSFISEPNLGDSCNHLIISKALQEYFVNGTKPEEYIKRKDHHIYDFCLSKKVDKTYKVIWGDENLPQRLNRFYVSTKGRYLYKYKEGKKSHMLKGWGVEIYNNHTDKPITDYTLDYRFYISETNKIINELEIPNVSQLQLF